jgi:hypothetical protein
MSNEPINLKKLPYAQWLEDTIQDIVKLPVKGLAISLILEDGSVYSNYHNIFALDKLTIAGTIQQDAMYDSMRANGLITNAEEDEEDESNGEEED